MSRKKKLIKISVTVPPAEDEVLPKSLSPVDCLIGAQSAIGNQDASHDASHESTEHDENREAEQALDVQETASITDDELRKELKRFLIPKIRSASYRWAERSKAIKAARVERGRYKCATCGDTSLKNGEYVLDHRSPVVPLEGWNGSWDIYIERMFVKAEGFQVLCNPCHDIKTETEVAIRKMHREKKKVEKNKIR